MKERRFAPPIEFWNFGKQITSGQVLDVDSLVREWTQQGYRVRQSDQVLFPGDYSIWSESECRELTGSTGDKPFQRCLAFNLKQSLNSESDSSVQIAAIDANNVVQAVWHGTPPEAAGQLELMPELFAEFYGQEPVIRREVRLGDTPPNCLNALLAIEDAEFLQHQGINFNSLARALLANLTSGRYAQGGSTITQQLVKNYFLTAERSMKRKLTEIAMSVLLEIRISKDEILETYINLIYMGQNGPFQIRGYGSAAEHYFGAPLENLNLSQCALLAAIVNSPGLFNPFNHPEAALQRRNRVLSRMQELHFVDAGQAQIARDQALPDRPSRVLTDPAPYFVDAVLKKIRSLELDTSEGLRVYTTMDPHLQRLAQNTVEQGLENLTEKTPRLKKLQQENKFLESLLVAVDNKTGFIKALVGGRNFRKTQFNRAIDAKRQIGSLMKPLVYLAALEKSADSAEPFTPLTLLDDSKFVHKDRKQTWSPENYDKKYHGVVPAFYSLSQSFNSSTAKLGIDTGLEKVMEVAERAGINSALQPFPSLSLGAFEVYPLEVVDAVMTLARMGSHLEPTLIRSVQTLEGEVIYEPNHPPEQRFKAPLVASLLSMMKQTLISGTAKSVQATLPQINACGKTGTTSDLKDAWFAGFTPHNTVVTWVGYDDNTSTGLTGASGALPFWITFMKNSGLLTSNEDFPWPMEELESRTLQKQDLLSLIPEWQGPDQVELFIPKKGL